ncbi:MAG: M23 family metallopeptidase [Verrucomicrobiota bacterium]
MLYRTPKWLALWILLALLAAAPLRAIVWPTPNAAFAEGKPITAFVQPTVSGEPESALYGCVRNDGTRFHEGLDLKAIYRDKKGRATDEIYAIMPGIVRYVNDQRGQSSYGLYVVVEHTHLEPSVLTLYAHLREIAPGIEAEMQVAEGAVLGTMGQTATGYTIPSERAHLHFEIALRLSNDFQSWYAAQDYEHANRHGIWNGMNLLGMDPLAFYEGLRLGEYGSTTDFVQGRPTAFTLRYFTDRTPDFVHRYPSMLTVPLRSSRIAAWDIGFDRYGVPTAFTPRYLGDTGQGTRGEIRVIEYDAEALAETASCLRLLEIETGLDPTPGERLQIRLEILFRETVRAP